MPITLAHLSTGRLRYPIVSHRGLVKVKAMTEEMVSEIHGDDV